MGDMTPEALLTNLETISCDKDLLSQSLVAAVKFAFVEKFSEGFDRPYNEDDFSSSKKTRELHVYYIKLLVENLIQSSNQITDRKSNFRFYLDGDSKFLASLLVMCGENVTVQPWNNESIVQNCQIILSAILNSFDYCDPSQLISKDHNVNLVTEVLNLLCPNLLASSWKYFPASVACFAWFLCLIKQPFLNSYLHLVLPPALLLVDDFVNENKIIGVKCLNHIIQNVAIAELQFYGHGDVIYSALLPIIRTRETILLFNSIPVIVLLATKLEFNFRNQSGTKWSRFDTILEILLENMELEQLLELRNCYINHLGLLIEASKHRIVRWSKRLLRIFEEYIQTAAKLNDEKSMISCIEALEKYIIISEKVVFLHDKKLLYMILVALMFTYNSSANEAQVDSKLKLHNCIKVILASMSEKSTQEFKSELQEICKNKVNHTFKEQFKNIIEKL